MLDGKTMFALQYNSLLAKPVQIRKEVSASLKQTLQGVRTEVIKMHFVVSIQNVLHSMLTQFDVYRLLSTLSSPLTYKLI